MAVVFITGKPGHGKTLYAIWHVKRYIENEHKEALKKDPEAQPRSVYYNGINDLTLDWEKFDDTKKWHKLPVGAVIVIDEAQKTFEKKSNAATRPDYYTAIDTHRHKGHDLFLITQDPVNVDFRITSMSDRHYHLARSYNTERATLYEYQAVEYVSGSKYKRVPDAIKTQWNYPKEVYTYYKSAEVHTYKQRLPLKKLAMMGAPFLVVPILVYYIAQRMSDKAGSEQPEVVTQGSISTDDIPGITTTGFNVISAAYAEPVIKDDPLSIPMYSNLINVRAYQRIDGCAQMKFGAVETCTCNDQRGNKLKISYSACVDFVQNGYFDYSVPDEISRPRPAKPRKPNTQQAKLGGTGLLNGVLP